MSEMVRWLYEGGFEELVSVEGGTWWWMMVEVEGKARRGCVGKRSFFFSEVRDE